ncbi:serine/threonine protein kinase [Ktedonospora formicarum]|uniref:non-specific serine/threonine protein kinase n=1 Tax=Ktedonospora formicarum TaxID=2778364 RepID=A0A8J3MUN4_9CHLR|nr:serine/threonine-protein kinase [Ktedonospora formicarum]GHO45575.1 hypothetical protein KSX_37380 [Ktedonospora formicarum]
MVDLTGTMLNEYYLFRRMALGGVADVYCASSSRFEGREVAVKVFRSSYAQHSVARRYFLSESRKISAFQHQHILPLLAYGEESGLLYAVSPLMPTGSLDDLMMRVGQCFSVAQTLTILRQLCEAVQYAHDHEVLHGNLKPSNIFIAHDGRMLLADFGLACGYDELRQSLTRLGWGLANYAAPEQALGVLRRASDIYALGVLLFRLLTGALPFEGLSPEDVLHMHVYQPPPRLRDYDSSLPLSIEHVVQRALKKHAEERFTSAREFSQTLQEAVSLAHPFYQPFPSTKLYATPDAEPTIHSIYSEALSQHLPQEENISSTLEETYAYPEPGMVQALPVIASPTQQDPFPSASWRDGGRQEAELFISADPVEWSPLLTALSSLEQDAPDIKQSSIDFARPIDDIDKNPQQEATVSRGRQWLPLLVLLLLLLGLLGALFSAFYFPHG